MTPEQELEFIEWCIEKGFKKDSDTALSIPLYGLNKHEILWNCMEWVNRPATEDNYSYFEVELEGIILWDGYGIVLQEFSFDNYKSSIDALEDAMKYYYMEYVR